MEEPKVSIIIPAYNGVNFLGETIQSVLEQTYPYFELIIVDDASSDNTAEVVRRIDDPRIKYVAHEKNKGSDVARDTGLRISCGEIIIFLDQDDLLHPEKLEVHVAFMALHPEVGVTYNHRFNLNHSSMTVRDMWCPPITVTLSDLVLGFPFAPSDVVLRREWAIKMDLLNGSLSWSGGEIIHYGGLFLAGCKFANVDRALNYRRYHSGRIIKDLIGGCKSEIYAQDKIFSDPRCPADVLALHDIAHANIYLSWMYRAFVQDETALGQEFLREVVRLKPSIICETPSELVNFITMSSIDDDSLDHEAILNQIFNQFPPELAKLSKQYHQATVNGYFEKGIRAIMWDRLEDGQKYFEQALKQGIRLDGAHISSLTHNLLNYELEFGDIAVQAKIQALAPFLRKLKGSRIVQKLIGCYMVNRAFDSFHAGKYRQVPRLTIRAIANEPKYLINRGVLSIFFNSMVHLGESKN